MPLLPLASPAQRSYDAMLKRFERYERALLDARVLLHEAKYDAALGVINDVLNAREALEEKGDAEVGQLIALARKGLKFDDLETRYQRKLREIATFFPKDIPEDETFNFFAACAGGMRRIAREALEEKP